MADFRDSSSSRPSPLPLLRFRELSPARQRLVRVMQNINYGRIEHLTLRRGEPVLDPKPVCVQTIKLRYKGDAPRVEVTSEDFELKPEVLELMKTFDRVRDGVLPKIDVYQGLPDLLEAPFAITA
jgi:hypothetical protein